MSKRAAEAKRVAHIDRALFLLECARDALKEADAPRALDKVRSALKSTEGARRHAKNRHHVALFSATD